MILSLLRVWIGLDPTPPAGIDRLFRFLNALGQRAEISIRPGVDSDEQSAVVAPRADGKSHSILDIPPVRLGAVVRPFTTDDDLLAEMLEGRS